MADECKLTLTSVRSRTCHWKSLSLKADPDGRPLEFEANDGCKRLASAF